MNRGGIWPRTVLRKAVVWWLRLSCEEKEPSKIDQRRNTITVSRGGISHDIAPVPSIVGCVVGIRSVRVVDSAGDEMVRGEKSGCVVVRDVIGDGMATVVSDGCVGVKELVRVGSVLVPVESRCIVERVSMYQPGVVEGIRVPDVVLNTWMIVHDDQVPEEK